MDGQGEREAQYVLPHLLTSLLSNVQLCDIQAQASFSREHSRPLAPNAIMTVTFAVALTNAGYSMPWGSSYDASLATWNFRIGNHQNKVSTLWSMESKECANGCDSRECDSHNFCKALSAHISDVNLM